MWSASSHMSSRTEREREMNKRWQEIDGSAIRPHLFRCQLIRWAIIQRDGSRIMSTNTNAHTYWSVCVDVCGVFPPRHHDRWFERRRNGLMKRSRDRQMHRHAFIKYWVLVRVVHWRWWQRWLWPWPHKNCCLWAAKPQVSQAVCSECLQGL